MTHAHATAVLYHWNKSSFPGRVKTNEVLIAENLLRDPSFVPQSVITKIKRSEVKETKTKEQRRWVSREFQEMAQRQYTYSYNGTNNLNLTKKEFLDMCLDEEFRKRWALKLNPQFIK